MNFIKPKKFSREIDGKWNGALILAALDTVKAVYCLRLLDYSENVAEVSKEFVLKHGWDYDKTLAFPRRVVVPGGAKRRIVLFVQDMTFEQLVKITNQIINMKAFL